MIRRPGINGTLKSLEKDSIALKEGGIDTVMFCNENGSPYQLKTSSVTVVTISYGIGKLSSMIEVPFGVNLLWDPISTQSVAKATGASFVREIFTGVL